MREIRDEEGLRDVWRKLGSWAAEVFWHEEMDEEMFVRIFSGGSHLYECVGSDGKEIGIVFFFAENPWAVKFGGASYTGRAKYADIESVCGRVSAELGRRGAKVLIAEVPAGKKAVRKILPMIGFTMCGIIPHYFNEEGLILFSKDLSR